MPGAVIVDERVEDVGPASGQPDGGRDPLSLIAFAQVVRPRMRVAADRSQCRHVHHPAQSSTVALKGLAAVRCVPESRGTGAGSGPGGELVGRSDQRGIANSGQEFGTESETDPGQAGDHLGEWMAAKSVLDVSVGGFDADIEGIHLLRCATSPAATSSPRNRTGPSGFWRQPRQPRRSSRRYAPRNRPVSGSAAKQRFVEWLSGVGSAPAAQPATGGDNE